MDLKKVIEQLDKELNEMHAEGMGGKLRHGRGAMGKLRGFEKSKVPMGARSFNCWRIDGQDMSDKEAEGYLSKKLKAANIDAEDMDTEEMMETARKNKLVK